MISLLRIYVFQKGLDAESELKCRRLLDLGILRCVLRPVILQFLHPFGGTPFDSRDEIISTAFERLSDRTRSIINAKSLQSHL